ncbi:AAA domain-containing protein [Halalkalicoccus jeotgali]|uniref:DNA helicase n=1 Tax=Halalkalicoccus jeotgali (strain DSM 18796 / CECT 7217 / JCM 14584 / KCTC 4019 / B3) TaxID=795797 RepID=D8J3A3_HALJB|nr:AAA domain-containing protein [Halalkalicoccus jeotgali]ADJ15210.1 DNA replication factor Dna2 [Halalkalicoccus jeotgali B3]ELY35213.1 DNA replication factor Dna2 [Halalkalicoccus jeotgali B3]
MQIRGTVLDPGETRTVSTRHGERDLAEALVRTDDGEFSVTLWGKWAETGEYLQPGMELVVTDPEETEWQGETGYATGRDSYVIVEPGFLVNVTDIRSWVQCPRMYYLNKLSGVPLNYPVVKGTIVHEVFGDLLRGADFEAAVADRIEEAGLELGLLDRDPEAVREEVRQNARAIDGWLSQGTLSEDDSWRSEYTLISERFGIKGRADALRRGMPVELKTGKNTNREPRFPDKIQAACYALLLDEQGGVGDELEADGGAPDTGTLLYTKNTALDRNEESGDLSPAKEFSIGSGLLEYVVRTRNEIAAMEFDSSVPTGYEANAKCEYCFERDTCMVVSGRLDQESKAGKIASPLPEREREYFDRMYEAVERERRSSHREYTKLWEQTPEERAEDDRALIGLEPLDEELREDGRWALRARSTGAVSKIREGDVALASDGDPISGHAELARIERLGEEIVVSTDEPVALKRLDVYPSDMSADGMLTALHDALLKGDDRRKELLFGNATPEFGTVEGAFIENNAAQNEAVSRAIAAKDFALIHGPPGTGKTYTIARAIRTMVERGERVLLSAFTNRAVDNALEALSDQGFTNFVRVGTEHGVREDMQPYRLDGRGEPGTLASTLREAPVVAATTSSCGSRVLREQSFDVALVDEASQLTEPATLAAINRAERFVLVGDHHQLPPVVQSEADESTGDAKGADLSRSLFERLIGEHPDAGVMLERQYRMAQRIQAFSSQEFYDGKLRPATGAVAAQRLTDLEGVSPGTLPEELRDPVAFIDVKGDDAAHTDTEEATRIAELVERYVEAGVPPEEIGVIAPFRAQVATITQTVREGVAVDTVDRFQGSSKEVILVSFVASTPADLEGPIFDDYRRLNVALTRAKKSLGLVGTRGALSADPLYGRMADWASR